MAAGESVPDGEKPAEAAADGDAARDTAERNDAADGSGAPGDAAPGDQPAGTGRTARELADAGAEALTEAAFRSGDFGPARELLQQARDQAAADGDRATEAVVFERLGMLAHYENIEKLIVGADVPGTDADAEERLFRQALAISQELGDQAGTARSAFGVGLVFQVLHREWPSAMPYYWQALDLSRALEERGDRYARSEIHRHLGFYFHYEETALGEAVRHLQLSLDLREEIGDPRLMPSALVALAEAELAAGHRERAIDLLTRAVDDAREAGLLQHRIEDAERALREAQAAAATPGT
jgi:tetratricopeptide (TPR) repeat protein